MHLDSPTTIDIAAAVIIRHFFGGESARLATDPTAARAIYASHLADLNQALYQLGEAADTDAATPSVVETLTAAGDELAALLRAGNPADYYAVFLRDGYRTVPTASLALAAAACRGFGLDVQAVVLRVLEVLNEKATSVTQQA